MSINTQLNRKFRGFLRRRKLARITAPPEFLINSIPKSGTHFLITLFNLAGCRNLGHLSENDKLLSCDWQDASHIEKSYITSHIYTYTPNISKKLLVVRDPAKVLLSKLNYIGARPDHHLYWKYKSLEVDEALTRLFYGQLGGNSMEERYSDYFKWAKKYDPVIVIYDEVLTGGREYLSNVLDFSYQMI